MILGREWADGDSHLFGGDDSSLLRVLLVLLCRCFLCLRAINENYSRYKKEKY